MVSEKGIFTNAIKSRLYKWGHDVQVKREFIVSWVFAPITDDCARVFCNRSSVAHVGTKFQWTKSLQNAINQLKHKLVFSPILAYPCPNCGFAVDTNASGQQPDGFFHKCRRKRKKL